MKNRCFWVTDSKPYQEYHDYEWGEPVYDDAVLFEFLLLETFQAGLNWLTILNKRENFRNEFDNFDYQKIANYSDKKYQELLQNEGIIRNRLKIQSAITNSQLFYLLDIARCTMAPNEAPMIQAYPPPPPRLAKKSSKPKIKIFGHTVPTAT